MRYRLYPEGRFGKHFGRLLQSIHDDVALALLKAHRDPETGVHEARKRCKEMRSLLRLLRPHIGKGPFNHRYAFYKSVAGELSQNRDAVVRVKTWQGLVTKHRAFPRQLSELVATFLAEQGSRDRWEAGQAGYFLELAARVEAEGVSIERRDLPTDFGDLKVSLKRIYRKAQDSEKRARKSDDIDDFHRFRKRSKDLLYCTRALRPLFRENHKGWLRNLRAMTELQGLANDQAVLLEYLKEHRSELGVSKRDWKLIKTVILEKRQFLQRQSQKMAKELMADSPAKFSSRL